MSTPGHQMHMNSHQKQFGKLGEPQTQEQKRALKEARAKQDEELTPGQKASARNAVAAAKKNRKNKK